MDDIKQHVVPSVDGVDASMTVNPVMDDTQGNALLGNGVPMDAMVDSSSGLKAADNVGAKDDGEPVGTIASCHPAPPVEIKLFVGRVPRSHNEDEIRPVFEEFGGVKEVIIIRDKATSNHKGSAFVRMDSICQADAAIRALNNQRVLDAALGPLQVKYATGEAEKLGMSSTAGEAGLDQAKLFVGSLPKTVVESQVREVFGVYGQVDEVFIMKDSNTGQGKGCAFVKFGYKEQALYAIRSMDAKQTMEGCSRPMEVRFAESRQQRQANVSPNAMGMMGGMASPYGSYGGTYGATTGQSNAAPRSSGAWKEYFSDTGRPYYHNEQTGVTTWDRPPEFDVLLPAGRTGVQMPTGASAATGGGEMCGPPGANIFIFHIPNEWSHQDLIQHFGGFGTVLSARIATDKSSGRNRGFAFVSYDNVDSAVAAVHHMNGFMAMTKRLKVTIKQGEEQYAQSSTPPQVPSLAAQTGFGQGTGQWPANAYGATNRYAPY